MPYVLVVDNAAPVRSFLRRRLRHLGYRAKEASNAAEALEMMLAEPAAIAVIDIRMPGQDGFWLAERIRERWSDTAIIIASGADDVEFVEKSRQLGAVDYVMKPFDRELLRQALHRAASASKPSLHPAYN
jgi:CheY-like chemotaxis protein